MKNRCKGIMEFHRIYLLITVVLSGFSCRSCTSRLNKVMCTYNDLQGYTERYDVAEEL